MLVVAEGLVHLQYPSAHELTSEPGFLESSQMRPLAHGTLRYPRQVSPNWGYVVGGVVVTWVVVLQAERMISAPLSHL